jgi:hypothetical protein
VQQVIEKKNGNREQQWEPHEAAKVESDHALPVCPTYVKTSRVNADMVDNRTFNHDGPLYERASAIESLARTKLRSKYPPFEPAIEAQNVSRRG